MDPKNTIELDFTNNPDIAALFSGKQPGDKVVVAMELTVSSIDPNCLKAVVSDFSIEGDSDSEGGEMETDGEKPVAIKMSMSGLDKS